MRLEGTILRGRSFDPVEGAVVVEDGVITDIEEESYGRAKIFTSAG